MPPIDTVYKVFTHEQAGVLVTSGRFDGSPDDVRDGFIHLSTAEQLAGTLDRHFSGKPMLFLGILPAGQLGDRLVMEPSRGGALFPHLYRPVVLADLAALVPIPEDRGGWRPPAVSLI